MDAAVSMGQSHDRSEKMDPFDKIIYQPVSDLSPSMRFERERLNANHKLSLNSKMPG